MTVQVINNEEELKAALSEGTVVVDFYASWCGPCKMLAPVLEEVVETKDVRIIKADVDEVPNIAREYNIMSVPTVIKAFNGEEQERTVGFMPAEALIAKLEL